MDEAKRFVEENLTLSKAAFERRQNMAGQLPNADVQILEAIFYQNNAIIMLLSKIADNQEGFSS